MPSAEAAIQWLAAPELKVSCHYVVARGRGRDPDGARSQPRLARRGVALEGRTDINSCSIGIEIHNPGHDGGYPDFPDAQMEAVEALCLDIIARHGILPHNVLAHSDVAPRRKIDPGEKFGWARLARAGIGHWTEPVPLSGGAALERGARGDDVMRLQDALRAYGYGIPCTGDYCEDTEFVVTAFQRHFRPRSPDGRADSSTVETLGALLRKLA